MENQIRKKLLSLGFIPELRGYGYLATAIKLCFESPTYLEQPIKELYIKIGQHFNVQAWDVERSIRCLITAALGSESGYQIRRLLGECSCYSRKFITNKMVISSLLEAIKSDAFYYTE